ncbi:nitrogen fixation protein NifH [Chloroflexota bacterium]
MKMNNDHIAASTDYSTGILKSDPLPWLIEEDKENPGIRYFALTDLLDLPADDPQVIVARKAIMSNGPVPVILANQSAQGYWDNPEKAYYPKYRGIVWQLTFLSQLGADGNDPRLKASIELVLDRYRSKYGGFSMNGNISGMIHCLQGNLIAALIDFNRLGDERLEAATDWLARSITGQDIAPATEKAASVRYYRSANSAPGFSCSANDHKPCAWGAIKAMLALSKVPKDKQTGNISAAIEAGTAFLLSHDPAKADYPMGYNTKPNRSWFKFGYPVAYITDILQNLEVLANLGFGEDPRLEPALDLLCSKQDQHGRWNMEYTYNGKTWVDIEVKGQPSKWVTLRALRVLKAAKKIRFQIQ